MRALLLLVCLVVDAYGYIPVEKDPFFPELFRDVVDHMSKDLDPYLEYSDSRMPLDVPALNKDTVDEQLYPFDYDSLSDAAQLHPSLRDNEFLQHSTLWGGQYMSGEGDQRLQPEELLKNHPEMKTDTALPAYCNPPNPCPIGYSAENGCLEQFKNTASFSRRYQAHQDCMCDTEHMFDCPSSTIPQFPTSNIEAPFIDLEFKRFLQRRFEGLQHKNLVAKKFHQSNQSKHVNPFLIGDRLPVAAKKGFNTREIY